MATIFRGRRVPAALGLVLALGLFERAMAQPDAAAGTRPVGSNGRALNLDFEDGTLRDWTATGSAFARQPIRGDTVARRRSDMKSQHHGEFWVGTFEIAGDEPQGTLTSSSFRVAQPWGSFWVAGGASMQTRVELLRADTKEVFFKVSGQESETLRPVLVDLRNLVGSEIVIRLVDLHGGPWGHINFDHFRLHATKPSWPQALDSAERVADVPPPADVVPFAGLTAEEACAKVTLPAGFQMYPFAFEPALQQPIAFCLDDRGRIWVAEGRTYPKRRGVPPQDPRAPGADRSSPTPEQWQDIVGGADRILVFEDTDGDHRADKRTVFLENVNLISGLSVGFGGVWIGAAPYLLFVPVSDWDQPKPAGPPRILLDGWNFTADTHETLNTFVWGPDGWLYGCHGVFCPSNVGRPGAAEAERQWMDAGVWRYHPTQHRFEVFTEGGSNPWGIDFDERGQLWAEMCVIPHLWHMIHGARIQRQGGDHFCVGAGQIQRYEHHRHSPSRKPIYPYAYDDIKQHADHVHWAGDRGPHAANARSDAMGGGHAHAGLLCYLGVSWPAEYRNRLFLGNIHGQRLNVEIPERRGSGFVGRHGKDFLNFNDTWSQTLNQLTGPDGSVYIIDWYDKNQCHHNREDGHDRSNGRLYKIVYRQPSVERADLAAQPDEALLDLVPSKNEWMSRHARRILQERAAALESLLPAALRDPTSAVKPEEKAAWERKLRWTAWADRFVRESNDPMAILRVLWLTHITGLALPEETWERAEAKDEYIQAWRLQLTLEKPIPSTASLRDETVILATLRPAGDPAPAKVVRARGQVGRNFYEYQMAELLAAARHPRSAVVRLAAASAIQRVAPEHRWPVLQALVLHGEDATDHNLPLMYWYAIEESAAIDPTKALALLQDCQIPRVREFIARRLTALTLSNSR